jgi:hypothetical protein
MFHALAIAALTAVPAQGGQLKLSNVRMTVGDLGPTRKDAKFLPGDALHMRFDINGITIEGNGEVKYKMESRVLDKNDKLFFKKDPQEMIHIAQLRGTTIPGAALFTLGLDTDPGNYTLEVTVEDPKTKAKDTISTKFEILKPDFGIVQVHSTADYQGIIPTSTIGTVGQTIITWYSVASFEREAKDPKDPKAKQPKIELQVQLVDEKGNNTLPEPLKFLQDKGVDETVGIIHYHYPLFLNRPGKFTIQITATDKVANKKATYEWPITVLATN